MAFGDKPYGLRDVKIADDDGSNPVDLPVAQTLSFTERINNAELRGDDSVAAVVANTEVVEWSLEAGGISLGAWAKLTGRTNATSGTTPSQITTYTAAADDQFPYLQIIGKSVGDGADDIHVRFYKAKVTSLQGSFGDQEFFITECSGVAIDDGANGIMDIIQHETAADISFS